MVARGTSAPGYEKTVGPLPAMVARGISAPGYENADRLGPYLVPTMADMDRTTDESDERICEEKDPDCIYYSCSEDDSIPHSAVSNRSSTTQNGTLIGWLQSWLLASSGRVVTVEDLREARRLTVKPSRVFGGHEHGRSAGLRHSAMETIDAYAKTVNRRVYSVSASGREAKLGWKTERRAYCTRDLIYEIEDPVLEESDIVAMIDVDYYLRLSQFSEYVGHTIVLYTVQPCTLSGSDSDCQFWVDEGGLYHESIRGGASFEHHLWDYGRDWVTIDDPVSPLRPSTWSQSTRGFWVYDVHRKVIGGPSLSRCLVFLTPRVHVVCPPLVINTLSNIVLGYPAVDIVRRPLARWGDKVFARDGIVFAGFNNGSESNVSVRVDVPCSSCATISTDLYHHIVTAVSSKYPSLATVKRVAEAHNVLLSEGEYAILASAAGLKCQPDYYVNYSAHVSIDDCGKPTKQVCAVPIVEPATAMTASDENIQHARAVRFDPHENRSAGNRFLIDCSREFGTLLFPERVSATDWVTAKAAVSKTPVQQARTKEMEKVSGSKRVGKSKTFMKAEEVGGGLEECKAGRLIYTLDQEVQVVGTMVTTAVKTLLARHDWFVVGLTPDEVTERVCLFVADLDSVVETDFSKMDATIGPFVRRCYKYWLAQALPKSDHKLLDEYLARTSDITIQFGSTQANSHGINLSGAPDTTLLNTLTNAFSDYCALRATGLTPAEAFKRIGPKYGDDGVSDPAVEAEIVKQTRDMGLVVKAKVIAKNHPVTFLSRVYIDPWATNTSFAEVKRALSKVPIGPRHKQPLEALADKVFGYLVTDSETPILGNYLRALVRVYGLQPTAKTSPDMVRRVAGGPYPFDTVFRDQCLVEAGRRLGLEASEASSFEDALDNANTVEDLEKCRLFEAIDYPDNVVA